MGPQTSSKVLERGGDDCKPRRSFTRLGAASLNEIAEPELLAGRSNNQSPSRAGEVVRLATPSHRHRLPSLIGLGHETGVSLPALLRRAALPALGGLRSQVRRE